jgi:hypothetical protein
MDRAPGFASCREGLLPMHAEMPAIFYRAEIDVRAPAQVAFAVVTGDLLVEDDDPQNMGGRRPLDEGPVRVGFRWRQRVVHNRSLCRADWHVTQVTAGRALEQSMLHFCADARRETRGGERWEFAPRGDGSTCVRLRTWRLVPGVWGWLEKLLGSRRMEATTQIELRRRLAYVQFEAERRIVR